MKNVVIIGAGPAGLTAAYELLKNGHGEYNVTILEESDMIGGISRTVCYKGNRMDIGGHRFFSKDPRVIQWWQDILPLQGAPSYDDALLSREKQWVENGPNPESEDRVLLLRNRISRIYYKNKFFDYPVSLKPETIKNMGLGCTIKAGCSYLASCIHKRPEDSLENFYINRFGKTLYQMFFEGYTEKLWGRNPSEIDASWGAQRVKGLSIRAVIADMYRKTFKKNAKAKETSLIEEFWYPKYGPGQMWETVAHEIKTMGGTFEMGTRVIGVETKDNQAKSVMYERDGREVLMRADIVISSMPIKDLVAGIAEAPSDIKRIVEGLPYRDFVTVGLLVDRTKLRITNQTKHKTVENIIPDCWIYVQDTGVKLGRIQVFNNWSPYMVKDIHNTVWLGLEYFCNENDEFWNMTPDERTALAIKELISMGIISEDAVLDAHCEKVKKAYPAYFDTYVDMHRVATYLKSFDNLYCVGRNGQHRYNNMDHSMVTAFETVNNILNNVKDQDAIWNVNTEKEFHEEKTNKE
jgi:protoporphyrinogen oxidase